MKAAELKIWISELNADLTQLAAFDETSCRQDATGNLELSTLLEIRSRNIQTKAAIKANIQSASFQLELMTVVEQVQAVIPMIPALIPSFPGAAPVKEPGDGSPDPKGN